VDAPKDGRDKLNKMPAGSSVKLRDFPQMKQPQTMWKATYQDYLWPLSAVGRAQSGFVMLYESFDSLKYWSNKANQKIFPAVFQANLTTLAYQPSSAFEESAFSAAKLSLSDNRSRLYETPSLAEAVVNLQHSLAREVADSEAKEEAKQS
jgi:hypothetical protein